MNLRRKHKRITIPIALFSIGAAAPIVRAETLNYGMDVGLGETDNVTLVSQNPVSQTIGVADLDFALIQQTRLLNVDAKGAFSYLDFLQHAYSNELIGRFDGLGKLALVPERLSWVLQDDFGQAQVDPFATVTPNNRENINYVSTGPDLSLRLGSTGFADLTGRYARTHYAVNPFDNSRAIGTAALGVELSPHSRLSVDGSTQHVRFDDTVTNTDFTRNSVYGDFTAHGARTDLTMDLGATKVDQGSLSSTGPLVKLELSRKLTPSATLTLAAGRDQTDASMGFSTPQVGAIGTVGTTQALRTSGNYTVTYGSIGWQYRRNRSTLSLSGRWEKDAYVGQDILDRQLANAELNVDRRLTETASVQVFGGYYRSDYANVTFIDEYTRAGAAFVLREGRHLELRLRYEHTSRSVVGVGGGYAENRAFLTIGYRSNPESTNANGSAIIAPEY
ncbi:MAG TPA: hypothetical protein VNF49_12110 [Candidatus Binataceae bacterium]|nr:hypothetical protein [Candidatus Binataceae bacterium]